MHSFDIFAGYYFHVEESNGALVLQRALDRETSPNVTVTIVATDQLSGASNLVSVLVLCMYLQ